MDFMFVRVLMKGNDKNMNVAYGLWSMLTQERLTTYFTTFCAGAVVVAIPITVLFIIMQKFYVGGITGGADKG
jgi:arabinogalactan oligomer/maltooligosaccharide transport system permease protein